VHEAFLVSYLPCSKMPYYVVVIRVRRSTIGVENVFIINAMIASNELTKFSYRPAGHWFM
jgi:hypothetical protein